MYNCICPICGSKNIKIIYDDKIRNGAIGTLTDINYQMYQCDDCDTIWHKKIDDSKEYYQSTKYRDELEHTADINDYYKNHDTEVLEKLQYTGTDIYRNKIVADIGCGGGAYLDFIAGPADRIVAIEPSNEYRKGLTDKGYYVYPYAADAIQAGEQCDVVASWDVIEHVDDPESFMRDIYGLLKRGGVSIIGTPSDCPIMRELLGHEYEQKLLFSYQHPWILSTKSMELVCKSAGFKHVEIKTYQRYGISNMISWLKNRKPMGHIQYDFITSQVNDVYVRSIEEQGLGDYLVAYITK